MPELPEVETIARQIRQSYLNLEIKTIEAQPVKIFQNISAEEFCFRLQGKKLNSVNRYGKYLIWKLENFFAVYHLGMSGIFLRNIKYSRYPKYIHICFQFEDGQWLFFQDVRKFSKIFLYSNKPKFNNIGIDPLTKKFTLNKFKELLNLSGMNIKTFLMDQKFIAGIGNIYANEALFLAGIVPFRPANQIKAEEAERLFKAIQQVLTQAIQNFGTSYSVYRTVEGNAGDNQNYLKIYQREGEDCFRCGARIMRTVINSRSTFYCPNCQK